jgi:hypothetical protein
VTSFISNPIIGDKFSSIITFSYSKYELKGGKRSMIVKFLQDVLIDDQGAHFFEIIFTCIDQNSKIKVGKLV